MNDVILKGYRALELNYKGKLAPGTKVEFETNYSYSVRYAKDRICVGSLILKLHDKTNPDNFYFNAELEGIFSYNEEIPREKIHILSFRALFPYLRAMISSCTAIAGVPPVMIPTVDLEGQDIYRIDTEHLKQ